MSTENLQSITEKSIRRATSIHHKQGLPFGSFLVFGTPYGEVKIIERDSNSQLQGDPTAIEWFNEKILSI